jgi:hypothetical protein
MKLTNNHAFYVSLTLIVLFVLDLVIIGGILIKGHANFAELIKHLKNV